MNARLTAKIVALGAMAGAVSDVGFEIPAEMDVEISELIECAEEFALQITQEESDGVLLAQLTDMLDAIKAELSA